VSVLQRCPSYGESNKGSKERQGPTLGVHFTEESILKRCLLNVIIGLSGLSVRARGGGFSPATMNVPPTAFIGKKNQSKSLAV